MSRASKAVVQPVPRLALSPEEAAMSIGVSRDYFDEHVGPELKRGRRGRRKFVTLRDLERWLDHAAARVLTSETTA